MDVKHVLPPHFTSTRELTQPPRGSSTNSNDSYRNLESCPYYRNLGVKEDAPIAVVDNAALGDTDAQSFTPDTNPTFDFCNFDSRKQQQQQLPDSFWRDSSKRISRSESWQLGSRQNSDGKKDSSRVKEEENDEKMYSRSLDRPKSPSSAITHHI